MTNPHPQEPREVMLTDAEISELEHAFITNTITLRDFDKLCAQAKRANAPALPAVSVVPGAKVLGREPTEEMVSAAFLHFNRNTPPTNPSGNWKAALRGAWDAAPSLAPPAARDSISLGQLRITQYPLTFDNAAVTRYRDMIRAGDRLPALLIAATTDGFAIWDGHHRYFAALMEGLEDVPVILAAAVGKAPAAPEVDGEAVQTAQFIVDHSLMYETRAVIVARALLSLAPAAKEKK